MLVGNTGGMEKRFLSKWSSLYVFGGVVFVLFASAEVQTWAMPESETTQSINVSGEKVEIYVADKANTDISYTKFNKAFSENPKAGENA